MRVVTLKDPITKPIGKLEKNIRKHGPTHAIKLIDD